MSESTGESNKSAFYDVQKGMGATFMEEGGWFWTMTFGDAAKEYDAIRNGVGVWDVSPLNKWDFHGPDALKAAQLLNTNDIEGMQVGQVKYGAFTDDDGLITDDGTVFKLADDHVWVMTNASEHAEEFAEATKGMNVGIDYVIHEMPHLQVQGPKSRETLQKVTDVDLSGIKYYWFVPEQVKVAGIPLWLSRTGFSGEQGFELFVDPKHAPDLWQAMLDLGCVPYGTDAVEPARIEAGMVVTDYDYEPHTMTPYDLSFDRLIKLDRDFRGRDAIRDVAANPPKRLKGLHLEGSEVPEYGAAVTKDGQPVGTLTSPASSPQFGVIGIAILDAAAAGEGERVDVALGEGTVPATVDANTAVYDPEKRRPRS
jgi:aminomethyltransferase